MTTDKDGYGIDRIQSGVFSTDVLEVNEVSLTAITRDNHTINERIEVSYSLTFISNPIPAGGYIQFRVPDDTFYKTIYTIESYLGSTKLTTSASYYTSTDQIYQV